MDQSKRSLLIRGTSEALPAHGQRSSRILTEMVCESLKLSLDSGLERRFRIGAHTLCEPDYLQILLWAELFKLEPEMVIEMLLRPCTESEAEWEQVLAPVFHRQSHTQINNGRITNLVWDIELLPTMPSEWQNDLEIDSLTFWGTKKTAFAEGASPALPDGLKHLDCAEMDLAELDLTSASYLTHLACQWNRIKSLALSTSRQLISLECYRNRLSELDLSSVPRLKRLSCGFNRLTHLELSAVPLLNELRCGGNELANLDLSALSQLSELECRGTKLTQLNLSTVPQLTRLECSGNRLTALDLSKVPLLIKLGCSNNQLNELDIRPLKHLVKLDYDSDKTRLIQRPDQNF